ncbi:recombinase RecX [Flavobacterium akiainvivens]|uniref:Regulatory protein RecX n=1 Tax=Flavobacterium akiainvivens TaxID=1202724 RepID=A0A0M8MJ67_9FLAO|nr:regulatory protein RecX [Flavobacterium akiainvivens]KOS07301.1 recombinase RecX [Flavobacterium akiainvivens]SFQ46415.1 regulatory protein [Flavobacterium akiainvivens]
MEKGYKTYTVEEAKRKMEQFCAYQERCHEEVVQKLRGMRMIPEAIDAVMGHLIEHKFINEERFARSFARGKFRIKQWGKKRIVLELKARGISKYNIDSALQEINPDEYLETFYALAQKQWEATREANLQKKKKKVGDFLLRKGFESNLVFDELARIASN